MCGVMKWISSRKNGLVHVTGWVVHWPRSIFHTDCRIQQVDLSVVVRGEPPWILRFSSGFSSWLPKLMSALPQRFRGLCTTYSWGVTTSHFRTDSNNLRETTQSHTGVNYRPSLPSGKYKSCLSMARLLVKWDCSCESTIKSITSRSAVHPEFDKRSFCWHFRWSFDKRTIVLFGQFSALRTDCGMQSNLLSSRQDRLWCAEQSQQSPFFNADQTGVFRTISPLEDWLFSYLR
jgi:hypothetical protein